MSNIAGKKSSLTWAVHISVLALVLIWLFPTLGLFVSSFRTAEQISTSGWWAALSTQERAEPAQRISGEEIERDGMFVIEGELFPGRDVDVSAWGTSARDTSAYGPGEEVEIGDGDTLTLSQDGYFQLTGPDSFEGERLPRVFATAESPPEFTLRNYENVLFSDTAGAGVGQAFINTLTVAIPSTIIPILVAAFAATLGMSQGARNWPFPVNLFRHQTKKLFVV